MYIRVKNLAIVLASKDNTRGSGEPVSLTWHK